MSRDRYPVDKAHRASNPIRGDTVEKQARRGQCFTCGVPIYDHAHNGDRERHDIGADSMNGVEGSKAKPVRLCLVCANMESSYLRAREEFRRRTKMRG